ncbi:major facilitator superfamily domain-containing protein [Globomyces pollinis-pini]|nr:major facilitator superfamily domain-containing protein [Globomyces pollinis-pini]
MSVLILLKALFFTSTAALACTSLYAPLFYYDYFGLSKEQVGLITSLGPLISLFSAPLTLYIGETSKIFNLKRIYNIIIVIGTLAWLSHTLIQPTDPNALLYIVVITIVSALTVSTYRVALDSMTLMLLDGKKDGDYGQCKLYGSISWGLSSLIVGYLLDVTGNPWIIIYVFVFFMIPFYLLSLLIKWNDQTDVSQADRDVETSDDLPDASSSGEIQPVDESSSLLPNSTTSKTLFQSLFTLKVLLFLFSASLVGMQNSAINAYLFIYFSTVWKTSSTLLGWSTPFSIFFEIPTFYYARQISNRLGYTKMLIISQLLQLTRFLLYMYLPGLMGDALHTTLGSIILLAIQITHGVSFGLVWTACVDYVLFIAPLKYRQTFIGIYSTFFSNAGGMLGSLLAGWVYENYGYFYLWGCCSAMIVVSIMSFIWSTLL